MSIYIDALYLCYEKDKSDTIFITPIEIAEEKWGERLSLHTPDKHATYYYIKPTGKNFAVKVGSIFKSIDGREFEIDWINLQWGTEQLKAFLF